MPKRRALLPLAIAITLVALAGVLLWRRGYVSEEQRNAARELRLPVTKNLDLGGGVTMKLVLIPPGEFIMGSPPGEGGRTSSDEGPPHRVRITKPFYMGASEVTEEQYKVVTGKTPAGFAGASNPVHRISWHEAVRFCKMLQQETGMDVRLPTEAEWEYACRAGTGTAYSFGSDWRAISKYAWWLSNSEFKAQPVMKKKPNPWGLYDMHGNLWEWCLDWYDPAYYAGSPLEDPQGPSSSDRGMRVLRSGSWHYYAGSCRSADRHAGNPSYPLDYFGFRVVASPR